MGLSESKAREIKQVKLNCIANKLLHSRDLPAAKMKNNLVDAAGFIVPPLMLVASLTALQLKLPDIGVVVVSNVFGAIIFAVTGIKLYFGWQKAVEDHATQLERNIGVIRDATNLLNREETASDEEAIWLLRYYDEVENRSIEMYGELPESEAQEYYRKALKEYEANAVCPHCKASPYDFKPGPCQLCGDTPVTT